MRPWQANLVGVGVAGLVVGAGLVLGAPEAIANGPAQPRTLNAPPSTGDGTGEVPVGDSLVLWGRPSKLGLFWTTDKVDSIARTYADAWSKAGMDVKVRRVDLVTSVSAIEEQTGLMRSVTIIDRKDERIVMPGLMDIRVAPDVTPAKAPVPVPENASAYMSHVADDASSVSYSGSYIVPIASDQVVAFYEQELGREGYVAREKKKTLKTGASIEFERDSEWISIVATDDVPAKGAPADVEVVSTVIVTHVRRLAPPVEWKP